jgi:tripartite ATP-independent transporter DctP family solute receptor
MRIWRSGIFLICAAALFVSPLFTGEPAAAVKYVIKFGSVGADNQPAGIAVNEVGQFLEEKSNGEIDFQMYGNSILGGDRQICEGMQIGTIETGVVASSVMAAFVPEMTILDFPYVFKTEAAARRALDGDLGDALEELLIQKGFRILAWGTNGYRHITNNKGPVRSPDDLKGIRIRTMENPLYIDYFRAMGANPTPMSFSELFTALQQKTVDAQETPITIIYPSRLYEVQKYISFTGHVYAVAPFVMSEQFFQKLPKEYQDLVIEAGKMYETRERHVTEEADAGFIEDMKKYGVEFNDLTMDEINVFADLAKPVYEQYVDIVGRNILDLALKSND